MDSDKARKLIGSEDENDVFEDEMSKQTSEMFNWEKDEKLPKGPV